MKPNIFWFGIFLIVYQSINKPSHSAPMNVKNLIFKQTAWRDQFDKQWRNNYAIQKSIYSQAEMYCSNYHKYGVKSMQNHWVRLQHNLFSLKYERVDSITVSA